MMSFGETDKVEKGDYVFGRTPPYNLCFSLGGYHRRKRTEQKTERMGNFTKGFVLVIIPQKNGFWLLESNNFSVRQACVLGGEALERRRL